MDQYVLTDAQWAKMAAALPRQGERTLGAAGAITGCLWKRCCGSRGRAAHGGIFRRRSGNWNTVFKRFRDWVKADVFKRLFDACSDEPDMEYAMVDATIVKVHRHGQGAKGGLQSQAIGKSKGGMTTKIVALTDALGNLVRFVLLPGQRYDTVGVPPLIEGMAFGALIGDKAFDSNAIIAELNERGAKIVISQHPRRARSHPHRRGDVQVAPSDRKLLLQAQGVQTHRHAKPTRPTQASPP